MPIQVLANAVTATGSSPVVIVAGGKRRERHNVQVTITGSGATVVKLMGRASARLAFTQIAPDITAEGVSVVEVPRAYEMRADVTITGTSTVDADLYTD